MAVAADVAFAKYIGECSEDTAAGDATRTMLERQLSRARETAKDVSRPSEAMLKTIMADFTQNIDTVDSAELACYMERFELLVSMPPSQFKDVKQRLAMLAYLQLVVKKELNHADMKKITTAATSLYPLLCEPSSSLDSSFVWLKLLAKTKETNINVWNIIVANAFLMATDLVTARAIKEHGDAALPDQLFLPVVMNGYGAFDSLTTSESVSNAKFTALLHFSTIFGSSLVNPLAAMFAPCYTSAGLVGPELSSMPGTKTPTPDEYFQAKFSKASQILAMMIPFKPPKDDARVGSPIPEMVGRRVGSPAPPRSGSDSSPKSPLPISGSPDEIASGRGSPAPPRSGSDGSPLLDSAFKRPAN